MKSGQYLKTATPEEISRSFGCQMLDAWFIIISRSDPFHFHTIKNIAECRLKWIWCFYIYWYIAQRRVLRDILNFLEVIWPGMTSPVNKTILLLLLLLLLLLWLLILILIPLIIIINFMYIAPFKTLSTTVQSPLQEKGKIKQINITIKWNPAIKAMMTKIDTVKVTNKTLCNWISRAGFPL